MSEQNNLSAQIEEIEALSSIYGDDWAVEPYAERTYSVQIKQSLKLVVTFTDGYPNDGPPHFHLDSADLSRDNRSKIADRLNEIYLENVGEPIVYIWVESIRDYLDNVSGCLESDRLSQSHHTDINDRDSKQEARKNDECMLDCPEILHGDPFTDRKSTFQAHVAIVNNTGDVTKVMAKLLLNKKIAAATHNIQAYRIMTDKGTMLEDCDDDGETHAGSRMLHLLNIVNAVNVLVVVSRWYGGIQLGPDRFKHINNCARNILEKYNFLDSSAKNVNKKTKSRNH